MHAADGNAASDATIRFLYSGTATIEDIVNAKLSSFMKQVWTTSWPNRCFDTLTDVKAEMTLRVIRVVSQYAHLVQSMRQGLQLIDKIRMFASVHQSEYCRDALLKAGLYEGAGCQMCSPQTGQ